MPRPSPSVPDPRMTNELITLFNPNDGRLHPTLKAQVSTWTSPPKVAEINALIATAQAEGLAPAGIITLLERLADIATHWDPPHP